MANEEKKVRINIRRTLVDPKLPPKPAHHFLWTRVGADITLDVGHFDLPEVRAVMEKAKSVDNADLILFVTDRFTLTPQGLSNFLQAAHDLEKDLKAQGMWPPPTPVGPSEVN
jgi:hypothetical protein